MNDPMEELASGFGLGVVLATRGPRGIVLGERG